LKQKNIVRYVKAPERMHEERTTKKITRWKPLSSRSKEEMGRCYTRPEFKSRRSRIEIRAYEGRSNGRKLLS
jgi:hypothetical protein